MEDFITQLNQTNPDATYSLNGDTVVGTWSKDASASGALGGTTIHMDYSVSAKLNADKTYSLNEHMESANSNAGAGGGVFGPSADPFASNDSQSNDGSINIFSSSKESFNGTTFGNKQMGFSHQFGGKAGSNNVSYNFDASKVKQPLIAALQAAGYSEQKKSFLKKLFGK